MAGKHNVVWSKESKKQVDLIYFSIKERWTQKEAEDFLDLLLHFQRIISEFPKAFKASPKNKNLRLGLIHRHLTAVYTIKKENIFIVTVFDNRSKDDFR
jgi:plasmid stabilization system protein ParE